LKGLEKCKATHNPEIIAFINRLAEQAATV
jgi:hypothetical protein